MAGNATMRKRRSRKTKAPATTTLARQMKTIALRQCETKIESQYEENNQLNHNRTYYLNNRLRTVQAVNDPAGFGNATGSRIGDEIVARGIKFKFWMSNKADRPNVMYNIYIYRYNSLESPSDSTFWRGADGNGSVMNRMLDQPNPEKVKVLKKLVVYSKNQFQGTPPNGKEHSYFKECWLPLNNKKVEYRRDGGGVPKGTDIGVALVCYDSYGTLITDTIASFGFSHTLYFKDP